MLGKANHIAHQHTPAPISTILEKDDETKNETNIPPTQEDVGTTDDEEEEASKDPTYTNKAKIENSSRRVTRSNKNPEDIHCSLIAHK